MAQLIRRLKPEEEEILRKREELAAIRAALAERELELVDLRSQLAAFEGRYLRQVGALYAELDEWKARISELHAQLDPSAAAKHRGASKPANRRARLMTMPTAPRVPDERVHAIAGNSRVCSAKLLSSSILIFCRDASDLERRTRFMAEANRAYEAGDAEALQRILDEYNDGADAVEGEGIGAELIRIIRQILSQARARVAAIEAELAVLREGETALLKKQAEEKEQEGRDLLAELATAVREQIEQAKREYDTLSKQEGNRA